MRAAIYLRISQDKTGEAAGVDRQREDCEALVAAQGWTLAETYVDNDISASTGKARPAYLQMLADISAGRIDAVVAWHPDRLYRKLGDLEGLIEAIDRNDVIMRTHRAGEIDLSTPTGRMIARILGATAQAEGEIKSDRWKRSVRQRRERGDVPGSGSRMYGYTWDGDVVPEEAEAARWMAEQVLDGMALNSLARSLRDRGIRTAKGNLWSGAALRKYLTNPRLAGHSTVSHLERTGQVSKVTGKPITRRVKEVIGAGTWEPILDQETWESVRALLGARSERRNHGSTLLVGLLYCGRCEAKMNAGARMNKRKETVRVYRCRRGINHDDTACGAVSGVASTIDDIVESYAQTRLADPRVRAAIRNLKAAPRATVAELTEVETRIQELEYQLDQPGVPVGALLRAIDRAKERHSTLLGSIAVVRTPPLPETPEEWPEEQAKRRALIELVVERVTLEPATKPGLFDPERVKIKRR